MKKIYTLASLALVSLASFAQETEILKFPGLKTSSKLTEKKVALKTNNPSLFKTSAAAGDTACWNNFVDFLPEFNPGGGQLSIFGYQGGGFVYGNNVDSVNSCATGVLNVTGTNLVISKVILLAAEKVMTSTVTPGSSYLTVRLWDMLPNKARHFNSATQTFTADAMGPNAIKATALVPISAVDTSWTTSTGLPWTVVTFSTPAVTNKNFAIEVNAATLAMGDTVGFISDAKNSQAGADLTFHRYWFGGATYSFWLCTDGGVFADGGLDNSIAFFAILDAGTAVTEYFNGTKLNALYPNPSTDKATIEYALENDAKDVSLVIYDAVGKKVFDQSYGNQQAGGYKVSVNVTNYAAGSYYYQLQSNGRKITKEFIVTK